MTRKRASSQSAGAVGVTSVPFEARTPVASDGGIFGEWISDAAGLPAYEYRLDQHQHSQAEFGGPTGVPSLSHWHQIGNDRIVAIGTNDGWVQLYSHENGPRWINQYRADDGAFAGGVSYLYEPASNEVWSTFYEDRPEGAKVRRIFGTGYFQVIVRYREVELDRVVFAPYGDGRLLASRVTVRNLSDQRKVLRHGEYWDVWLHDLTFGFGPSVTRRRDKTSNISYAGYRVDWDDDLEGLRARHPRGVISHDLPFAMAAAPSTQPDIVCVPIGTSVGGWSASRDEVFGEGGRARPEGLIEPAKNAYTSSAQGVGFLLTTELELDPGKEAVLGFGYGAVPPTKVEREVADLGADPRGLFESTLAAWKKFVPKIELGGEEWLSRELAWGAYYLRSGATYHQGYQAHTLSQGGAYQYELGMNAGPRATLQHALPLIWLAPEMAAEALLFTMAETSPEGEISFGETGTGLIDDVRQVYIPSDNDLWLLWVASEYVLGTRDRSFLRQSVSYWPAPYTRPEPVWDHLLKAFHHLINVVGTGSHGLLKIRTGDWNDLLVHEATSVAAEDIPIGRVWEKGESTLNTAMAVHVLRRFAELADMAKESATAESARNHAEQFAEAVRSCWRGRHLNRAWLDEEHEVGFKDLYLEPQPWALISGVLGADQARTLVDEIRTRCADPLAARIFAAGGEGNPPTALGGVWPSINSTLVWGYGRVDPQMAWKELKDNTLHHHAETYPEIWYGIWSGPDTYLPSSEPESAGKTTPFMRHWPVQILFAHSEPLSASISLVGIEPTASGLRIDPLLPFEGWTWNAGLVQLTYHEDEVTGALGSLTSEVILIDLTLPSGLRDREIAVEVSDRISVFAVEGHRVIFRLPVAPGSRTPFRVFGE